MRNELDLHLLHTLDCDEVISQVTVSDAAKRVQLEHFRSNANCLPKKKGYSLLRQVTKGGYNIATPVRFQNSS